jgi:hypothetical protein
MVDLQSSDIEYAYGTYGNMAQDLNNGITSIQYNAFNLPEEINFSSYNRNNYQYSADGVKRKVLYATAISGISIPGVVVWDPESEIVYQTDSIDYCGNIIYVNPHCASSSKKFLPFSDLHLFKIRFVYYKFFL